MRLGAPVFDYHSAEEWALCHVKKGLGAAYWPLPLGSAEEAAYVDAAHAHGLVIAEVGGWNNVLAADADQREGNIRYAIERLRTADRVGARCCVNIAGSRADQWDGPHPGNFTDDTFAEIVRITQRIIDEAAPKRTRYTLEPMPWMYPCGEESMARLLGAVDREAFGVHVDMANLCNGVEKIYRTGALSQAFIGRFAKQIRSVHAKDVVLHGKLTTHIDEAIPGQGMFDWDALLTACAALGDVPVMAEHLQNEAEYDEAVKFLRGRAQALDIVLDMAHEA